MSNLRSLQQMKLSNKEIDDTINFLKHADSSSISQQEDLKDFTVKDNQLVYKPLNLIVVKPDDRNQVMQTLYDGIESAGKGQNNWYRYITTKYLGITKRQSQAFLKSKEDYQLTRSPPVGRQKPILANRPFQIVAIDLVDMNQYVGVKQNKGYRYIFSMMDLFSGYSWFKPVKKKEPENIVEIFDNILAESNDQIPAKVVSDNGNEWKGAFDEFLKTNKIQHIFTKSYTPEPHIEAVNNQLRKIMRQLFVRNNSLAWLPSLPGIQSAKNSQYNENHDATPDQILSQFEADTPDNRRYLRTLSETQLARYKADMGKYSENLLESGDYVRIKLAARQTQLRQKMKAGNKKLIVVHWTPEVYRVKERKMPKQGQLGYPKYVVENMAGQYITKEGHTYPQYFNRTDLLKVSENQRDIISQKNANTLNRLNNPEDIMVEGDEARAKEAQAAVARAIPVARVEPIVKTVSQYKTADWNMALKGKEFSDDGERYVILKVEYKRADVNNYIVDCIEKRFYKNGSTTVKEADRPLYVLYAVLKEAKRGKEDWWSRDYDVAIRELEARDKK